MPRISDIFADRGEASMRKLARPLPPQERRVGMSCRWTTTSLQRWWRWFGALLGAAILVWVLRRFDLDRFRAILVQADLRYLVLLPLAIIGEQWVRAWKWRQLLYPIRPIGTLRLFGAIMAGYLTGLLVPFGFASLTRSWLVARREGLPTSAVLATVALDRLTDGVVFALLVPLALALVVFPDPNGDIRAGLSWGAAGSLVLCVLLLLALAAYRSGVLRPGLLDRLPERLAGPVRRAAAGFASGIVCPRQPWRGLGIAISSIVIKLIAATHFLWVGLALGAALQPAQYLFVMVFLGFLVILGYFARVAGSFVIGAVFVLGLFGVAEERALAMVLTVETTSLLSVAGFGAFALWRQGVALADLRSRESGGLG